VGRISPTQECQDLFESGLWRSTCFPKHSSPPSIPSIKALDKIPHLQKRLNGPMLDWEEGNPKKNLITGLARM
jgi:hypothetical protein